MKLLLPAENGMGFNLLDDKDFTIPYLIYTIPNSPESHKIPTQDKKKLWIIDINGEKTITAKGALDELQHHQIQRGKSKVKISIYRRKRYQSTHIEEVWSICDKYRPVFLYIEVRLPEKPLTSKDIGKALEGYS